MSQCNFIISILIILSLTGCEVDTYSEKYYAGVILIKANADHQNGLIEALDVFAREEGIEASGRAIVYSYENGNSPFDLEDTVTYKIKFGDVMTACEIRKDTVKFYPSSSSATSGRDLASTGEMFQMNSQYKLNLHLADKHREGPKHIKKHISPPKSALSTDIYSETYNYKQVTLIDPDGLVAPELAIIYDPFNLPDGLNHSYFVTKKEVFPSTILSNLNSSRDLNVYDISKTHDHIID